MFKDEYVQNKLDESRLSSSINTLAAWAGAGMALAIAGPVALKGAGYMFSGLAAKTAKLGKVAGGNERLSAALLSDSYNSLNQGAEDVSQRVVSASRQHEATESFFSRLMDRANVHTDSTKVDYTQKQLEAVKERIAARMNPVVSEGSAEAVRAKASSPEVLDDFLEITKDIDLGFDSRDSAADWLSNQVPFKPATPNSASVLQNEDNYTTVKDALLRRHQHQAKREKAVSSMVQVPNQQSQVKLSDLIENFDELTDLDNDQLAKVLEDPFSNIRLTKQGERVTEALNEAGGDDFVRHEMSKIMKTGSKVFGEGNYKDWVQTAGNIQMGLAVSEKGVLSVAKAQKTALSHATKVLDEATLPLFPGMFHVNLGKMMNFMKGDSIGVKQLGKIKRLGEVSRAIRSDIAEEAVGLGIGDKIISYNPKVNSLESLDGEYVFYSNRTSKANADAARRRGNPPPKVNNSEGNIAQRVWRAVKPDTSELDILDENIYSNQDKLFNIAVGADGVTLVPRGDVQNLGLEGAALRKITPGGAISLENLHPNLLQQVIDNDDSTTLMRAQASELLTQHAARAHGTTASTLKQQIDEFSPDDLDFLDTFFKEEDTQGAGWLTKRLAEAGEDPDKVLGIVADFYEDEQKRASLQRFPKMNKVFAQLLEDTEAYSDTVGGDRGFINVLRQSVQGHSNISKLKTDLQGAMIDDVLAAQGLLKLRNEGMFELDWKSDIVQIANSGGDPNDHLTRLLAKTAGLDLDAVSEDEIRTVAKDMASALLDSNQEVSNIKLRTLGKVAADTPSTSDHLYNSRAALAKIEAIRTNSIQSGLQTSGFLTELAAQTANSPSIKHINKERFGFGRANFRPPQRELDEMYGQQYYVTGKFFTGPDTDENVGKKLKSTLTSLIDSDESMNSAGHLLTTLGQMPDDIGRTIGLGLHPSDKMTLANTMLAFGIKRVLPLVVGAELYKNINADADNLGLPGIDDFAANLYANAGVGLTSLLDFTGSTDQLKELRDSVVGLDQYMDPRSKEEFDDWLHWGDEEVRKGRFWVIGSRNNFTGGAIEAYRPNFYRRMKSNWTAADNVQIADPMHSFLPTLTNPLAPVWGMFNPWAFRHRYDRPYVGNDLEETLGSPLFSTRGEITVDRSGPYSLMTGGGLPGAVWAAAQGEVGEELGESSIGSGGGYSGAGRSPINYITATEPIKSRSSMFGDTLDGIGGFLDQYKSQTGLYGAFLNFMIPSDKGMAIQSQSIGDAIGLNRLLNNARMGELSGPFGEYFRRFLGMENTDPYAYSPYLNNMPSWMPANFRCITADTLVEVDGTDLILAKDLTKDNKVRNAKGDLDTAKSLVWRDMDPDEKLYEVTCASTNTPMKMTEEHPVWTPTGWRPIEELEEGDWVGYPIPKLDTLIEDKGDIDITDYISDNFTATNYIYNRKITLSFAKLLEYTKRYKVIEWEKGECKAVCEKLGVPWYSSLAQSVRRASTKPLDTINRYIDIHSKEWAIFLGYYLSVGSVVNNRIFFKFKHPDKLTISILSEAVNTLFGTELKVDIKKKSYQLLHINSKPLVEFLRNYIGTGRDRRVKIGYTNKKRFLKAFVRGYGFINNEKPVHELSFNTLYHLWQLLLNHKIGCTIEGGVLKCQFSQRERARKLIDLDYQVKLKKGVKVEIAGRYAYFKILSKKEIPQEKVLGISVTDHPSFCLPGLLTHNTGDPYTRTPFGETVLPGDALERVAPWVTRTKVRGSMIGLSEEDLFEKLLNPIGATEAEAVEYGSFAHKQVQKQLHDAGMLIAGEVPIYDAENNISGTIDAIVRDVDGPMVVEIKSQQNSTFSKGEIPEKYLDQLNFYLATTGQNKGLLAFVNSERPDQVRLHTHYFDPERHEQVLTRIRNVRERINDMVEARQISPFETYDMLSRLTVLSKAAPNSREFYELAEVASKNTGMSGYEQMIYENLMKQAGQIKNQYRLYANRTLATNTAVHAKIISVNNDGSVTTNKGTFELAGIKLDHQASSFKSVEEIYEEVGIRVGDSETFILNRGAKNKNVTDDMTVSAVVASIPGMPSMNEQLVMKGYAEIDIDRANPLDYFAIYSRPGIKEASWEMLAHHQNFITDKFMRVRTPLEQLKRGEVYGSDYLSWSDPIGTLVIPMVQSLASQGIVESSIKGSLLLSLLARTSETKGKLALAGSAVGLLSAFRFGAEFLSQETWLPEEYKKRQNLDDYFDKIEFIKQSSIAEHAKLKAFILEGVNIDALNAEEERVETLGVGKWSIIAIQAEKKARNTMYGYNTAKGTLQQAIMALPSRHRQIVEETILYGSDSEKAGVYDLLSDSEKRIVAKYFGKAELEREKLSDYFGKYFLPDASWRGWRHEYDIEDIKAQSLEEEGTKIAPTSSKQLAQARERTRKVPIPRLDAHTAGSVEGRIQRVLYAGGGGGATVRVSARPSTRQETRANMNITVDQSKALEEQLLNDLNRE